MKAVGISAHRFNIMSTLRKFYDFKTIFLKPLCNQMPVAKLSRLLITNKCY